MTRNPDNLSGGPLWLLRASQIIVVLALIGLLCAAWQLHLINDRINHATQLGYAASHNETAAMETMLKAGYDPNAEGRKSRSPLYWASLEGNIAPLRLLISYGADVRGAEGTLCLCAAAKYGRVDVVQELLKHGANSNKASDVSLPETPLSAAKGNPDAMSRSKIIALLKAAGAKK